jgi:hypothetical protein
VGQVLTAEHVDLKLTDSNRCPRVYYDGENTIYLYGCWYENEIDIFSISTGTITRKTKGALPGSAIEGTVQADNFGNIFYFGGGSYYRDVYKFDPRRNQSSVVATLPFRVYGSTSVKYNDSSNTVYIFGGREQENPNTLLAFDLVLWNYTTIASNLTYLVRDAASVQLGNKVYIFGNGQNKTIEFDLDTFQMSLVGPPDTLPVFTSFPSATRDETHAYLIGGRPSNGPTNGIYQIDLKTFENTFLPVENFPIKGDNHYYDPPASVYVKKQNRIYFFGGSSSNRMDNDIFYIDLTPLKTMNPDFFNCINRTNGNLTLYK